MSKSSSLPKQPYDDFDSNPINEQQSATPAWKQEVNQRLAAHRTRRGGPQEDAQQQSEDSPRAASKRAAEAAARVAARYAKAPSYSEVLAGEARAVVHAAGVAAQAARSAQKAAQAVLAGLESAPVGTLWDQPAPYVAAAPTLAAQQPAPARWQDEPPVQAEAAPQQNPWTSARPGAQPRWEEALPVPTAPAAGRDVWSEMRLHPAGDSTATPQRSYAPETRQSRGTGVRSGEDAELFAYHTLDHDEYVLDASDPLGSATVEPVQPIPANLIEFPRELVATRKARPRLAEGPFYDPAQESPQLSIFEVDPDQLAPPIFLSDTGRDAVAPPEWASIELDHHQPVHPPYEALPAAYNQHSFVDELTLQAANAAEQERFYAPVAEAQAIAASRPAYTNSVQPNRYDRLAEAHAADRAPAPAAELIIAPLSDRILAAVVDGALVTLAFLAAAVVVIASTSHPPTGRVALVAGICGLLLFGLLYQFLFFSYAEEGTPGMRYARVALCTFTDDNPTREQMRMRIPALLVAAVPAGLGLLWALVDGDRLAWHDRLTRTYQRKY